MIQTKICNRCKTEKSVDEFYSRSQNRLRNGEAYVYFWQSLTCKSCENLQRSGYAKTEKGQLSAKRSYQQRMSDPEKRKAMIEYQRSEHGKEVRRRYQTSEKGKAQRTEYMRSEQGHELALKRWTRHKKTRRRAIEDTVGRKFSSRHWRLILRAYDYACAYCSATGVPLSPDHVVPLAKGGDHRKENIVPACTKCNQEKGDVLGWQPKPPRNPLGF